MKKTKCEVFSRVNGYLRPVGAWNDAKQAEFKDRVMYKTDGINKRTKTRD